LRCLHVLIRRRPLGREIIYIKVGKEKQDFGIHKELISHYSPYFRAAFTFGFDEAKSGIMKLPEIEAEIFEIFYMWLYKQNYGTRMPEERICQTLKTWSSSAFSPTWHGFLLYRTRRSELSTTYQTSTTTFRIQ
jgi:hypothetical protein